MLRAVRKLLTSNGRRTSSLPGMEEPGGQGRDSNPAATRHGQTSVDEGGKGLPLVSTPPASGGEECKPGVGFIGER
jgi:hypothetical protein